MNHPADVVADRPARLTSASPWWVANGLALAIFLFFVLRLALVMAVDVTPSSDAAWYRDRAIEMLERGSYSENGIPTAYWPVGYVAFLAGVMAAFGRSVLTGQLANIVLSCGCLVLLHRWCLARWADRRIAAVAVLLFALYPNQVGYGAVLYTEPLYTLLLLTIVLVGRPAATFGRLIALGCLAGLATLVKTQTLLLAPCLIGLLLWGAWNRRSAGDAAARTGVALLFMALTIAPWTYRNHLQLGAYVPVSTNGGISLLSGNNPSMSPSLFSGEFAEDDDLVRSAGFSVADQVGADARARRLAGQWIAQHPLRFAALVPKKLLRLWLWDGESEWAFQKGDPRYADHAVAYRTARGINQVFYLGVLALGLHGLVRTTFRASPSTWVPPLLIAYFTLISLVFSGQSRYHAPLMPFVIGLAAWAIVGPRERRRIPQA